MRNRRRVQRQAVNEAELEGMEEDDGAYFDRINLDDPQGPLNEWITQDAVAFEIKRQFRQFLTTFVRGGANVYEQRIKDMCSQNKQSLEVNSHLHVSLLTCVVW